MTKAELASYAPQQVFLMQGSDTLFDQIVGEFSSLDPLVQGLSVPRFTIDHARSVAEFASEGTGTDRTFIVSFSVFSPEAAQVLLKPLEEPSPRTTIIFVTPYPYLVPRTVRSRLMLISSGSYDTGTVSIKTILEAIQKEAAEKEDDAATRRGRATALLDDLERAIKKERRSADFVYKAKAMLFGANMPTKYILDYVTTVIR